jgi:predicted dehydrogenase
VKGLYLAVNQNGRWAPHFSYLREIITAGLIGRLQSASFNLHWDHRWILGTPYEKIQHLILYDFGIHWFDLTACFFGERRPLRVYAAEAIGAGQQAGIPMLAHAAVEFDDGLASLTFNANIGLGQEDRSYLAGDEGSAVSIGPSLSEQTVTLFTEKGHASPKLEGTWFREGFQGAMGELLCAIEARRPPINSGRDNLKALELCFAAVASAVEKKPIKPGEIRRLLQ